MKSWRFYKVPNDEVLKDCQMNKMSLRDTYRLYALTNKKELAKKFMEQRDMSRFIVKSDHAFDELEAYSTYANRHRSTVLEEYDLTTRSEENKQKKISLVITYGERQEIEEPNVFLFTEEFWNDIFVPTILFKPEYQKALELYTALAKMYAPDLCIRYGIPEELDDYAVPGYTYDEVNLFLRVYGDTLKL